MNTMPIMNVKPEALAELGVSGFDLASYLNSDEVIAEYISAVLDEGNTHELLAALNHIAKAKGMASVAAKSGLGRESLYKALAVGAKPRFDTVLKVIRALGIRLHAQA